MTLMSRPTELWNSMPGWGIAADLTPTELINARQLTRIRRWMAAALVLVLLACVGGWFYASRQASAAQRAVEKERAHTRQLQNQTNKYAGITKIQGTITKVRADVAKLMAGDVALPKLLTQLDVALPSGMVIKTEAVTISTAAVAGTDPTGLNNTGNPVIGSIALAGTARRIVDVATYVASLQGMAGIVDVVPLSNVRDRTGLHPKAAYNITLDLTSALLSHRFDHSITGGK
jgi:hypothetical protein